MKKLLYLLLFFIGMVLLNNNVYANNEYNVGDIVIYNKEAYYVIENSDISKDYITLLKAEPLNNEQVTEYNESGYVSENGEIAFADSCLETINIRGWTACISYEYETSNVNVILNNWVKNELKDDDLVKVNNYKVRLLTIEELVNNLGYENANNDPYQFVNTQNTPIWMDSYTYNYWNMDFFLVGSYGSSITSKDYKSNIRPVINLKKQAIDTCQNNYRVEKEILYRSQSIHSSSSYFGGYDVLRPTDENTNYVVALKRNTFTDEEISRYSNGVYNNRNVPFYINNLCNSLDNRSGCTNNYDDSIIKTILDNWERENFSEDDLVSVDGYKSRLITVEELVDYYGYRVTSWSTFPEIYESTSDTSSRFEIYYYFGDDRMEDSGHGGYEYEIWTMSPAADSTFDVFKLSNEFRNYNSSLVYSWGLPTGVWNTARIRPVFYVNKCSIGLCNVDEHIIIDDECKIEESVYETNNNEKGKITKNNNYLKNTIIDAIVNVGNTFKKIPLYILIVCTIFIIGGIIFFTYCFIRSKKEKKKLK